MITRRQALQQTTLLTAACATGAAALPAARGQTAGAAAAAPAGPFTLPPLPYAADALEPHLDAQTMQIHHGRHHAAYVANLNKAVAGQTDLAGKSVEDLLRALPSLPEGIRTAVRNHGGGHYNHTLFWQMLKKGGDGQAPRGELGRALETRFGPFATFKQQFTEAAMKVFGSGWAWLTLDGRELRIESIPNQDTPLSQGRVPLLGVDVWEHAYYLKYQNRRADYLAAFFNVIHWDYVAERYRQFAG